MGLVAAYLLAWTLANAACACFHQAHPRRTKLPAVYIPGLALRLVGSLLLLISVVLLGLAVGWERGIAVFLGMVTVAGLLAVYLARYRWRRWWQAYLGLVIVGVSAAVWSSQ
jgi:hypothetical protein